MTKRKNDGGPAFPQFEVVAGERDGHGDVIDAYTIATGGMSLRDWFAGMALCGSALPQAFQPGPEGMAIRAYELADAMLKRREGAP